MLWGDGSSPFGRTCRGNCTREVIKNGLDENMQGNCLDVYGK